MILCVYEQLLPVHEEDLTDNIDEVEDFTEQEHCEELPAAVPAHPAKIQQIPIAIAVCNIYKISPKVSAAVCFFQTVIGEYDLKPRYTVIEIRIDWSLHLKNTFIQKKNTFIA